jgi:hypothetical protein
VFQADAVLNLTWVLLCAAAAVYFWRSERRRSRAYSRWARMSRGVAVFLAVVSLFPCVSASDDSARFEFLNAAGAAQSSPQPADPGPAEHAKKSHQASLSLLVRLLEALDSVQISAGWRLILILFFLAVVLVERREGLDRQVPLRSGRAPPALLPLFA